MILRAAAGLLLLAAAAAGQSTGGEAWSGFADVRNRFVTDVGGNSNVYRSIVNLGEGPRLFGGELRFEQPGARWADEFTLTADRLGGDPSSGAFLSMRRDELYDLQVRYRNFAYFNNLPTFANPLLQEGLVDSQRALDITRRQVDLELTLRPGRTFEPFFGVYRADGFGRGVTTFVTDGDEFPVATDLDDGLTTIRGGLKIRLGKRYDLTVEQGRTDFSDDQRIFYDQTDPNPGNRPGRLFGRDIVLRELAQRYRADGRGQFSRGLFQGRPNDWLSFSGQFLYSQPKLDVRQELDATGSFLSLTNLTPFGSIFEQNLADANRPHSTGSWNAELRPHSRLRIIQSWFTDRYHVSSGSTLTQMLNTADPEALTAVNTLAFNYSRHQVDLIFDVNRNVTVRGGHRYDWGSAEVPPSTLQLGPEPTNQGSLERHVALAGGALRLLEGRLRVHADFEASPGDETFFRTGLMNYRRGTLRVRHRFTSTLSAQGSFQALSNQNDAPGVNLDFLSRQAAVAVSWTPASGPVSLLADYTHTAVRSDIDIVSLPFFGTELARYRDRGRFAGAYVETRLPRNGRLQAGGALAINRGSRPTELFQPLVELQTPLNERLDFMTEWRYYGFNDQFLRPVGFRTHTFSVGLRASLR